MRTRQLEWSRALSDVSKSQQIPARPLTLLDPKLIDCVTSVTEGSQGTHYIPSIVECFVETAIVLHLRWWMPIH